MQRRPVALPNPVPYGADRPASTFSSWTLDHQALVIFHSSGLVTSLRRFCRMGDWRSPRIRPFTFKGHGDPHVLARAPTARQVQQQVTDIIARKLPRVLRTSTFSAQLLAPPASRLCFFHHQRLPHHRRRWPAHVVPGSQKKSAIITNTLPAGSPRPPSSTTSSAMSTPISTRGKGDGFFARAVARLAERLRHPVAWACRDVNKGQLHLGSGAAQSMSKLPTRSWPSSA